MALIICPECSHNVSDKAISCPNCGYPINLPEETKSINKATARAHAYSRQKKKNPKLPNGFGSIKKLSGNRRKPYAAYPPITEYRDNGSPAPVECVGYFKSWHEAYSSLVEWHRLKGEPVFQANGSTVVLTSAAQTELYKSSLTFAQVYDLYYEDKFRELPGKKALSKSAKNSTAAAFKNCASLHDKVFCSLVARDLQEVVDSCPLKHASLELISMLFKQMYAYAIQNDLTDKNYAQYIKINIDDDDETGVPFSQEDIRLLWAHSGDKDVQRILIMIYSGFRVSAYPSLEVNLEEKYFKGGVKTKASKNRIVPIHNRILPFIDALKDFPESKRFRTGNFSPCLESLGILYAPTGEKHTPHDCRHTFSWLCDKYGVDSDSKHLLMGHALKGDVEKQKYTHRTIEQLRTEINKITV